MRMTRLRWMRLLRPIVGRFPAVFYRVALGAGWLMWTLRRDFRENLIRNLTPLCDGDEARARKEGVRACQFVAQYYVDLTTLPRRNMATFEHEHLELRNAEYLDKLDAAPVVAVSAHTGNPELAVQALVYRGREFVALVEAQEPREWSNYLLKLRSAAGARFYEVSFGGVRACLETLKRGGLVGVMGDRDIQENGVCVELCGRWVKVPLGPWELARRTDALVLPVFVSRIRNDNFRVDLGEPYHIARTSSADRDICEAVTRWTAQLEKHLRRDPGQWVVLEDFWGVHACEGRHHG